MKLTFSFLLITTFFFSILERKNGFLFIREPSHKDRKYSISKPHYIKTSQNSIQQNSENNTLLDSEKKRMKRYSISRNPKEDYLKKLNSKNKTEQMEGILGDDEDDEDDEDENDDPQIIDLKSSDNSQGQGGIRIIINKGMLGGFANLQSNPDNSDFESIYGRSTNNRDKKSENFEVITKFAYSFKDIGGFDKIKNELLQCVDFLSNYTKYQNYNIRIPKGLILEGPPGNGKTLLAKGFAGEAKVGFIAVSGSEFQEKYVGVGSSRVRELFQLAKKNVPCIIFIDEIDAIGRKRSGDGETSSSERDSTLNELLVNLDGFKNNTGIFLIGATNRADLLDSALTRPGRIDKRIYIGLPDSETRKSILNIHIQGKPYDESIVIKDMVDLTMGLSGAQIENLLNEAMLNALRNNNDKMKMYDIDIILNRIMAGWQPTDHQFTTDIIDHIAIHEMGHAIVGMVAKHHSKMTKVVINLSSPKSPGYTVFEASTTTIFTREALFEHLAILLAGRIAEEVFYGVSTTTGAIGDFEEAYKLAEKMIVHYGMGAKAIYPSMSEKYKQMIDNEVFKLINDAYSYSEIIVKNSKDLIAESAEILKKDKILTAETLMKLINNKYKHLFEVQ
jgi:ATP-dependent metalloprotease FtsH